MKVTIKKEISKLYYLRSGMGKGCSFMHRPEGYKVFVRVPYIKKDGKYGSKMYCESKQAAIVFDSVEAAKLLQNQYDNTNEEVRELDEKYLNKINNGNYYLKEIEVQGVKCYLIRY